MNETAPKLLLNVKEATHLLGISARLLWSMTNNGEIPHCKIGRRVMYSAEGLKQWVDENVSKTMKKHK